MPYLSNKAHSLSSSLAHKVCNLDCVCACHRKKYFRSPNILNTILGSLFLGYKALPWSPQKCDQPYCRSHATRVTYAFPPWLLRRAISVSMAYSHQRGPDLCLRVMKVRPGDANIFTAVFRGTRHHIQRLLDHNEASVCDVDPAHNTALQVSPGLSFLHPYD